MVLCVLLVIRVTCSMLPILSMQFFSQHDPAFDQQKVGNSNQTIHAIGCFGCSIATLYQIHPLVLFRLASAFNKQGNLDSGVLAKYCGGVALVKTKVPPKGWCIAMTDFYSNVFYPTHFFCYSAETKQMIDPLDYPCAPKPMRKDYKIVEYRPFSGIKLNTNNHTQIISAIAKISEAWTALSEAQGISPSPVIQDVQVLLHQSNNLLRAL